MNDFVNPLHLFGICFPHKWGKWMTWDDRRGWVPVPARHDEPASRQCEHCNEKQERD